MNLDKNKILQVKKPWGDFRQFTHNQNSTVKIITVNPNEVLSLQSHSKRAEFWRVIKGSGVVEINGTVHEAKEGDEFTIGVGDKHRMSSSGQVFQILEIATGNFDEEDIVRYEDKYGRS